MEPAHNGPEFIFGTPEEVQEKLKEAHQRHHDLHEMSREDFFHKIEDLMNSLEDEHLMFFSAFLVNMAQMDDPAIVLSQMSVSAARIFAVRNKVCPVCMKDHDAETQKLLDHPMQQVDPANVAEVFGVKANEAEAFMRALDLRNAQLEEYGLDPDPNSAQVQCRNCKQIYPSLEDRMMKEPGIGGCPGCIQKTKFG